MASGMTKGKEVASNCSQQGSEGRRSHAVHQSCRKGGILQHFNETADPCLLRGRATLVSFDEQVGLRIMKGKGSRVGSIRGIKTC